MKKKEIIFVQECGTYTNQILVLIGCQDKNKLFKYLKKIKTKADFAKWVLQDFDNWKEDIKNKNIGQFCYNNQVEGTVLVMQHYEDSWEYWEVLMHEIHHVVQYLAEGKGMLKEIEAQAYLFEFLFRSIRRKIQGVDKIL